MKKTDFTKGSVSKSLMLFFLQMLFTNILQQVYSLADMIIIGKGLGDAPVAAVGNFTTLSFILTGFTLGLTNGFSVNIAQAYGENNFAKLKKLIASSIKISAAIAAVFSAAGLLLLRDFLLIMKTDVTLIDDCLSYGHIIFIGLGVSISYNLFSSVLRGLGDSKTPLLSIGIASVINIILDMLFIFVFRSGIWGPAFATIVSQLISAVICYLRLHRVSELKLCRSDFIHDSQSDMDLLKNGLPMGFMNSVTSVGCIFVQGCINSSGVTYTSAYSACNKYLNLFMLPGITIGFAVSSFSGQNYGAGKYERIRSGTRTAVIMSLASALLTGIILFFLSDKLARLILAGQEAILLTCSFLKYLSVFMILLNLLFVFRSCLQGAGKPAVPMYSGIIEMIIRIAVIYLGLPIYGFTAAVYAEGMAWTGALTMNVISYLFFIKQMKKAH